MSIRIEADIMPLTRICRSYIEPDRDVKGFKKGDLVVSRQERMVVYEIIKIAWACPPDTGGVVDLKFWGMNPRTDNKVQKLLGQRDLVNDVFGSFTKDLDYPDNGMELLAISSQ